MKIILSIFTFLLFAACSHYPKLVQDNNNANIENISLTDTSQKAKIESLVTDTVSYAKSIMDNKEKYIGKQFSVLLNDLKIPPKSYFLINSRQNINAVPSIEIFFDDERTTGRKIENIDDLDNPVILKIVWKIPVLNVAANEVVQKSTKRGDWQAAEQDFYSKQVVGDIFYYYNSRK